MDSRAAQDGQSGSRGWTVGPSVELTVTTLESWNLSILGTILPKLGRIFAADRLICYFPTPLPRRGPPRVRQSPGSAKIDHLPAAGSYTPHIYGPGVRENAPEFRSASFPLNMPHIWDRRFGNIVAHNRTRATPALVLGEWGGEVEGTSSGCAPFSITCGAAT